MDEFARIYNISWAILAIAGGVALLVFREQFRKGNARIISRLYEKTGFSLLKDQADSMDSTYMRMVSVLVAVFFIVMGIYTLSTNI